MMASWSNGIPLQGVFSALRFGATAWPALSLGEASL